ncbi:MAG: gliding motility-associated C-terminal domain-containing protein [Bacteroidia bacterium]|nr:gliding motility-associated C-terminal domain-containing protein [Bacteroidia bacterium]
MRKSIVLGLLSIIFLFSSRTAEACSPLNVPTLLSQSISGPNLLLNWSSNTIYNCTYNIQVEIVCNTGNFTGVGPFFTTAAYTKTTTPWALPQQSINISTLCPGTVYKFRAREMWPAATFSGWTATFTFTTPGTFVQPTITLSGSPTSICTPQTSQLNCTINNSCGGSTPTYSWTPSASLSNPAIANPVASPTATTTYTCVVTGGPLGCWTASNTITITTAVPPVAGTASVTPNPICAGTPVTLTLTGYTGTIQWQSGPTSTGPWTNIPSATTTPYVTGPLMTSTCFQAVVTGCGSVVSNPVCVTVSPPPSSTQSQTNILCNGQCTGTATVNASGGPPFTYVWTPSGGNGPTATGLCAGNYTVTITNSTNCTSTAVFTITQPTALSASTSFQQSTCGQPNGSASVTVSGGTPAYSYLWSPSGGTNASATGLMAGNYTVIVTDANGCTISANVTVPSAGAPSSVISASANVSCFGGNNGSASVTVTGGTPAYTYLWSPSGGNTANATGLTAGNYTVTVTDANGCVTSTTITISQPPQLTLTAANTGNVNCFGGNNGSASSTPSGGTPGYTYAWTPSGGNGQNATGLTAGTYTVTVTDANGCTASATVVITQPTALSITTAGFAALCNGSCNGQAVTIPAGGTLPYTYNWTPSGGTNASATGLCAGTYTIIVTDANGCTITDTAIVSQPAPLAATTTVDTSHCNLPDGGACVNATGGVGPYTYLWSPSGQTAACATNLTPGQYCVTITDANGCTMSVCATVPLAPGVIASIPTTVNPLCFGLCTGTADAQATGGIGPYSYAWAPSGGNAQTATGLCAGTYSVTVTDASGCISTATCIITQPPQLTISTSNPATICIGQCVTLTSTVTGGTPAYTVVWSPAGPTVCPTVTTSYTVTVTDANGCTAGPQTATVSVNAPLSVSASVAPNPICIGSSASLTAMGSGGSGTGYSYQWLPINQTGNPVSVSPTSTTTYTVVVSDNCNTPTATATVTLTVNPLPVPVSFPPDSGCAPFCTSFTDLTPNATAWSWNFSGGTPASATGSTTGQICWAVPGTYDVVLTVTDNNGCVGAATVSSVTVLTDPIAGFTPSASSVSILNPEVCFSSTAVNASTYLWDFGAPNDNNNTSTLPNPCHLYTDTGTYCIQQIVTSVQGCRDSITHCIKVEPDFTFYAPNAFTPDGNGTNDGFLPVGEGWDRDTYELWIFDRWGKVIFYSQIWNKPWDGKVQGGKGELVQEDVYVWRVNIHDYKGQKHKFVGHVSVIR